MMTYQELLEQALQLSEIERLAIVEALQATIGDDVSLTAIQRFALLSLKMPRPDTDDNLSERADEVVNELMQRHLIDHDAANID